MAGKGGNPGSLGGTGTDQTDHIAQGINIMTGIVTETGIGRMAGALAAIAIQTG